MKNKIEFTFDDAVAVNKECLLGLTHDAHLLAMSAVISRLVEEKIKAHGIRIYYPSLDDEWFAHEPSEGYPTELKGYLINVEVVKK